MFTIFIGAIVMFVVGALWFTVLFGKVWSRLMNFTPEMQARAKRGGMASKMVVMFILNLITASVVYHLVPLSVSISTMEFVVAILVIWLGFTLPSLVNAHLWEGKSVKLVLINAGGSAASFIAGSIVIYLMA